MKCAPVIPLRCHECVKRRFQRTVWLVTFLTLAGLSGLNPFDPLSADADTKIIPSIIASQSYDSNVWGGPSNFVPAGKKQGDFVSAVSPQIQLLTKNRQMETALNAGVSGNLYVNNPELDYVSINAGVFSNLDGWINQFIEGAKLKIADNFVYTPQPPSFLTGGQPPQTADVLLRGIQGVRANTFLNNGSVSGSYELARGFGLQGRYDVGIIKFGQIFVQPTQPSAVPVTYFDTTYHNFSVGPTYAVTPADTVSVNYEPTLNYLSGQGREQSFTTQGLTAQYVRTTPHWTARIRGGAVALDIGKDVFFSGGLSLTGNFDKSTRIRVTISRKVTPAFYAAGGATLSDTAGLYIDHKISRLLTFTVGANYGHGTTVPVEFIRYTSYRGTALLRYEVTRLISASLSYDYYYSSYESPSADGVPSSGYSFPRNVVMLSLNATWK